MKNIMKKRLIATLIEVIHDLETEESRYFQEANQFGLKQVRPLIDQGISLATEIAGQELRPSIILCTTLYFESVKNFYETMAMIKLEQIERLQKGGEKV